MEFFGVPIHEAMPRMRARSPSPGGHDNPIAQSYDQPPGANTEGLVLGSMRTPFLPTATIDYEVLANSLLRRAQNEATSVRIPQSTGTLSNEGNATPEAYYLEPVSHNVHTQVPTNLNPDTIIEMGANVFSTWQEWLPGFTRDNERWHDL